VPASAEVELILRRAGGKGLIEYILGEERFKIVNHNLLNGRRRWALYSKNGVRSIHEDGRPVCY